MPAWTMKTPQSEDPKEQSVFMYELVQYLKYLTEHLDEDNVPMLRDLKTALGMGDIDNNYLGVFTDFVKINEGQNEVIAAVKTEVDSQGANIISLTKWTNSAQENMAKISQKADANGASIESLVSWKNTAAETFSSLGQEIQSMDSKITQSASEIRSEVTQVETTMLQNLASTKSELSEDIKTAESNMDTNLRNTESNMDTKLSNAVTTLNSTITQKANEIDLKVTQNTNSLSGVSTDISNLNNSVTAQLALKVGKNENDQIVSMLNASANQINIKSNRLTIDSDNFKLTAAGDITANSGKMNNIYLGADNVQLVSYKFLGSAVGMTIKETKSNAHITLMMTGILLDAGDDVSYIEVNNDKTTSANYNIDLSTNSGRLNGSWYLSSGSAVTSDENKKNSIEELPEKYSKFFDGLKPRRFKYNDGTSDRYHVGFVAQEVSKSLDDAEISTADFGGVVTKKNKDGTEDWYLRYEEFIALQTAEIQRLKKRVDELERKLEK